MGETGSGGRPPFSPTIALLTVSRVAEVELAAILEPHGLTLRKYGILGHIAGTPGLSLGELARRSRITPQSVHTLVGALVAAGLVRSPSARSGQAVQLTVTDAGNDLLARLADSVKELDDRLFSSDEMTELAAALAAATAEKLGAPQD